MIRTLFWNCHKVLFCSCLLLGSSNTLSADTFNLQSIESALAYNYNAGDDIASLATVPQRVARNEVIYLDPGHGGKDFGTADKALKYKEKSLTIAISVLVQGYLKRLGYKAVLTRSLDTYVDLTKRAQMANYAKADAFVSIHCNHSSNPDAYGTEIYHYNGRSASADRTRLSADLGNTILSHMVKNGIMRSRGLKTANFAVIRETVMPSVLIEVGFLSNPNERSNLLDPRYRMKLARGIAEGIHAFLLSKGSYKHKTTQCKAKKARPTR